MIPRLLTLLVAITTLALAPPALADHHAGKGKDKGQATATEKSGKRMDDEMRARRDERKEIMDEAKSVAEPGTPRKGKKPWWRFWESDEPEQP